jgi:hypothetical protein
MRPTGLRALVLGLVAAAALAGCLTTLNTFPPEGSSPRPAGAGASGTIGRVISALAAAGLQAGPATREFRPVEGPLLAAAPRTVLQVVLPDDPEGGWIVVYSLASPEAAAMAAKDQAAYLGAGIGGGIQYAPGTQFVLPQDGSSVVFFSWLPANSPDKRTATIAQTLPAIGQTVEVVR